jgi:hypothetical protein
VVMRYAQSTFGNVSGCNEFRKVEVFPYQFIRLMRSGTCGAIGLLALKYASSASTS